jgi:hypothetical protein
MAVTERDLAAKFRARYRIIYAGANGPILSGQDGEGAALAPSAANGSS